MLVTKKTKVIMGVILGVKGLILLPVMVLQFPYAAITIMVHGLLGYVLNSWVGDATEYLNLISGMSFLFFFTFFVAFLSTGKSFGMLFAKKRSKIVIHTWLAFVDEIILIALCGFFYGAVAEDLSSERGHVLGLLPVIGSAVCVILHIIALVTLRKSKAEKQEHIIGENILLEPVLEENI